MSLMDTMPTNLRFSERNMWEAVSPTQAEVRILLERISRLRAALDDAREQTAARLATGESDV